MNWKHIVENLFSVKFAQNWLKLTKTVEWIMTLCITIHKKLISWMLAFFWQLKIHIFLVKSTFLAKLPSYPTATSGQPPPACHHIQLDSLPTKTLKKGAQFHTAICARDTGLICSENSLWYLRYLARWAIHHQQSSDEENVPLLSCCLAFWSCCCARQNGDARSKELCLIQKNSSWMDTHYTDVWEQCWWWGPA